ncbi:Holliday junction branch migration protein RuvA [Lachnospiraceae bacterium BX10]|uniref:Holliday junction branch migration complex subunit RuvA n=1 Tax=Enterocloster hominis (ex Liu et al. 2021) TaxID=2763663 RepID=A0ABR7NT48_9FIRM|nr:Holliday junction branch migration protein RuvA [Enterocloster hominis]MBC8599301.1 Holliday junction branch migration protein RuvA [Enterocloster hominis]
MISYIRGTLAEKNEDSAVVEAHGVGYQIFVPVPVLSELPPLGESVKIYTYFSVREDGMSLFGFLSRQDLAMFKQLIGINGIGPKSALGILSALRPDVLRMAVASGDAKTISRAPGVGPKTAQRIILDLKDKIRPEDVLAGGLEESLAVPEEISGVGQAGKEAVEALTALGYSAAEAAGAVKKVKITEEMTAEDVLKGALRHLAFL